MRNRTNLPAMNRLLDRNRSLPAVLLFALLLSLGSACASGGQPVEPLTPEAELPESYRQAWRAWYEESEEWPRLREQVSEDPELAAFLVDNLVRVMVRFYDHAALAERGELPGPFERARRELVYLGPHSAPVCIELVVVGDGPVAFLASDVLDSIDDPRWTLPVAERLAAEDARERRRAAGLLALLPHARGDEEVVWDLLEVAALTDAEWSVRAQAVETVGVRAALARELSRPRRILSLALADDDSKVVQTACAALGSTRDPRAVPAVINLLEKLEREGRNVGTARAAQACLCALTAESREREVAEWRSWWRENHP